MRKFKNPFTKLLLTTVLCILATGCASYKPTTFDEPAAAARAERVTQDNISVSATILNRQEAEAVFGALLFKRGVQPVWISIENNSDTDQWFMLHGLDPNYFSANEAAYMNHKRFGGKANRQMDEHFSDMAINPLIRAGETNSGFAFANETVGTREIRVRLFGKDKLRDFDFYITVPGLVSNWEKRDLLNIFPDEQLTRVSTEEELERVLQKLPCCTTRQGNLGNGLPVNVVLIDAAAALKGLIRAGWDESQFVRDFSNLLGTETLYDRTPDVVFSKSRRKVKSTTTLRLWVTPIRYQDRVVLAGTINRSVDPDIDESALYLFEDLGTARGVESVGLIGGAPKVPRDKPVQIFGSYSYWTNGNRLVLEMSETESLLKDIRVFEWDWPGRRIDGKQRSSSENPR